MSQRPVAAAGPQAKAAGAQDIQICTRVSAVPPVRAQIVHDKDTQPPDLHLLPGCILETQVIYFEPGIPQQVPLSELSHNPVVKECAVTAVRSWGSSAKDPWGTCTSFNTQEIGS